MTFLNENMFRRYDVPTPRYTSFPIHPLWKDNITPQVWLEHLASKTQYGRPVDIYIHLPYCEQLCYYCGCNRTIKKDHSGEQEYIEALKSEWELYNEKIKGLKVRSIHLGGGTPTFFSAQHLDELISIFGQQIIKGGFYGSVELDPRTTKIEQLQVLRKHDFTKASLGVQDFNYKVQKAVNRIQPAQMVEKLCRVLRDLQFTSINFDLIYGLPYQTEQTIQETIKIVQKIRPDTISIFAYAHLPTKIKNQSLIDKLPMKKGYEKRLLFETAREFFLGNDYHEIGLDHFALKTDELYQSYESKKMQRTFMGYVPYDSEITIGLGASSISASGDSFVQNERDVTNYIMQVKKKNFPFVKGHLKNEVEKIIEKNIQDIMCYGQTDMTNAVNTYKPQEKRNLDLNLNQLKEDNLIQFQDGKLTVTPQGHPFLRNICMGIDPYNTSSIALSSI